MAVDYTQYIFCLEGEWEDTLKSKNSILPTLEFLEHSQGVKFLFRKVALAEDLFFYLDKAVKAEYKKYSIIHLAFHGNAQKIWMADHETTVNMKDIADKYEGKFCGRVVHFGSCKTLKTSTENLKYFLETTGAELVSGYTKDVDFVDSSIFDIVYFTKLQNYKQVWRVNDDLKENYPGLHERLGFKAFSKRDILRKQEEPLVMSL